MSNHMYRSAEDNLKVIEEKTEALYQSMLMQESSNVIARAITRSNLLFQEGIAYPAGTMSQRALAMTQSIIATTYP